MVDIERERVEAVMGLTGGEMESTPMDIPESYDCDGRQCLPRKWKYWYMGIPEWSEGEFRGSSRYNPTYDYSNYFTLVATDCSYGTSAPAVIVDPDGLIWLQVVAYSNSGECECPLQESDGELDERPCKLCEAESGQDHGYIYLGPCAEIIYVLVGEKS